MLTQKNAMELSTVRKVIYEYRLNSLIQTQATLLKKNSHIFENPSILKLSHVFSISTNTAQTDFPLFLVTKKYLPLQLVSGDGIFSWHKTTPGPSCSKGG